MLFGLATFLAIASSFTISYSAILTAPTFLLCFAILKEYMGISGSVGRQRINPCAFRVMSSEPTLKLKGSESRCDAEVSRRAAISFLESASLACESGEAEVLPAYARDIELSPKNVMNYTV